MGIAKPQAKYIAMPSTVTTIANGSNMGYNGAFSLTHNLKGISLSSNLTSIGNYSFYNSNLANISLPESVQTIDFSAFLSCSGLTSISLPSGVTTIGSNAFYGCKFTEVECNIEGTNYSLIDGELKIKTMHQATSGYPEWYSDYVTELVTSVTFLEDSSNITTIGSYAFRDCSITSISLPSRVTTISASAFWGCINLKTITIPESVQTISANAFGACQFTEVECSIEGTNYSLIDGELQIKTMHQEASGYPEWHSDNVNLLVTSVTFLEDSSSITTIGYGAFNGCSSLTSISLPSGVQTIGSYAFQSCNSLTSISLPESLQTIGTYAFSGCSGLTSISLPSGVQTIGPYAFSDCKFTEVECSIEGTNYSLIDGELKITTMHQEASGTPEWYSANVNPLVTSVTFSESNITTIGTYAFAYCSSLTSISLPSGVTTIGTEAFSACSSLTSINLPSGVTTIGTYAFFGCSSLEITILSSVTSIGDGYALDGVKKAVFNGTVEQMESMLPSVTGSGAVRAYYFIECSDGYYEYVNIGVCMLTDTEIICWDKKRKRWIKKKLKDLTYDDELLVWNFDEGKFDKAKPLFITEECKATRYTQTTFSDGSILNTVGEDDSRRHRLFNVETGRFEYIGTNMKIGTKTFNSKGEIVEIVDMKFIDKEVTYQNVITEKHFNAFASGILTSSRFNNLYPIKDMKYVKNNRTLNKREDFAEIEDMYFEGLRLAEQPVGIDAFSEVTAYKDLKDYVKEFKARSKER